MRVSWPGRLSPRQPFSILFLFLLWHSNASLYSNAQTSLTKRSADDTQDSAQTFSGTAQTYSTLSLHLRSLSVARWPCCSPSGHAGAPPGTASAGPCARTGRCGPGGSRQRAGRSRPRGGSAAGGRQEGRQGHHQAGAPLGNEARASPEKTQARAAQQRARCASNKAGHTSRQPCSDPRLGGSRTSSTRGSGCITMASCFMRFRVSPLMMYLPLALS